MKMKRIRRGRALPFINYYLILSNETTTTTTTKNKGRNYKLNDLSFSFFFLLN